MHDSNEGHQLITINNNSLNMELVPGDDNPQ